MFLKVLIAVLKLLPRIFQHSVTWIVDKMAGLPWGVKIPKQQTNKNLK
jgi:hypothetical protein